MNDSDQQKIKILHVITTAEMGGAQLSTLRLLTLLNSTHRFDISLLYGESGPLEPEYQALEKQKTKVIRNPLLCRSFNPFKDLFLLMNLIHFFRKKKFNLVHTHCSKPSLIVRFAAFCSGIPGIIHTYHGFGHDYFLNPFLQKLYITLEFWLNKKSAAVIFIAKENLQRAESCSLVSLSPKNHLIPDCLDFETLSISPSTTSPPFKIPCMGSVLNFKEQKQPFALLNLFKRISLLYPSAQFILAGEGSGLKSCQEFTKQLNLSNVHFMGVLKDMEKFYSRLTLYVSVSRYEGLSMAELECLYLKIPMVLPFRGGITEIMKQGEQGFFYPLQDLNKALEHCCRILDGNFKYIPLSPDWILPYEAQAIRKTYQELYSSLYPFFQKKGSKHFQGQNST